MNKQAFTLVELIVSIVILAILGTIGFISLSGYAVSARDSTRASDMRAIEKQLSIHIVKFDKYPEPDDKVNIIAGGNVVSYQGYAGKGVLDTIKVFNGGKDPVDDEYYVYSTNVSRTQYQLLGYFENGLSAYNPSIVPQAQAEYGDLTSRVPQVKGDPIGILLDTVTKQPIQDSVGVGVSSVNITTSTTTYDMVANNEDEPITASGAALVAVMPVVNNSSPTPVQTSSVDNSSCKTILDTGGSTGDGTYAINPTGNNEFDAYCDMTTDGGGWTMLATAIGETTAVYDHDDIMSWTPKNSDNCGVDTECISTTGVDILDWDELLVYTRGYKVKGTACNDLNTNLRGYSQLSRSTPSSANNFSAHGECDDEYEVSNGHTVSDRASNSWIIRMGVGVTGNDSVEYTLLGFGPIYIPQGFGTDRYGSGRKIYNFYSIDQSGQPNLWDGASTSKQNWFIR